jgi:hypothetical protein
VQRRHHEMFGVHGLHLIFIMSSNV